VRRAAKLAVAAAVLALAAAAVPAGASLLTSPSLWATLDVCKASGSHGTVGVRASMPGTGNADERMYMFFRLQYRDPATGPTGTWYYLDRRGDSGFVDVGNGALKASQSGRDFQLALTPSNKYLFRAVVIFDWRLHSVNEHHVQLDTTAGHHASAGASPADYTAAYCTL
jgi:hypothetical protein